MVKPIKMPELSTTLNEIRLMRWLKVEGDNITRGETLCEIETDKATMEIESFATGTLLKIIAGEDSIVLVGDVIAWIGEPGESFDD